MKVKELISILERSDPEAIVVANLAFAGGITQITAVERHITGGFDLYMSFDKISVVELSNGQANYMRSQGRDVEGVEK